MKYGKDIDNYLNTEYVISTKKFSEYNDNLKIVEEN